MLPYTPIYPARSPSSRRLSMRSSSSSYVARADCPITHKRCSEYHPSRAAVPVDACNLENNSPYQPVGPPGEGGSIPPQGFSRRRPHGFASGNYSTPTAKKSQADFLFFQSPLLSFLLLLPGRYRVRSAKGEQKKKNSNHVAYPPTFPLTVPTNLRSSSRENGSFNKVLQLTPC